MQNLTLLAALLKENVRGGVASLVFRKTPFLNMLGEFGRVEGAGAGQEPFSWQINSAANGSVESFSEGQAPPLSGAQTYKRPSLNALVNARAVFGMTGHARDNADKNGYHEAMPTLEESLTKSDVLKQGEDLLWSSTQDVGVPAIIDSTGTYAGLSQGSVSSWASEENNVGGVLTIAAMEGLFEEMLSPTGGSSVPRGATPSHWLMPVNQFINYGQLAGAAGAANAAYRFRSGDKLDLSVMQNGLENGSFMGIPIRVIEGITSTELYLVDIYDMTLIVHRDLRTDMIASNPENLQWQVSWRAALKVERRNHHGKLTGVTA